MKSEKLMKKQFLSIFFWIVFYAASTAAYSQKLNDIDCMKGFATATISTFGEIETEDHTFSGYPYRQIKLKDSGTFVLLFLDQTRKVALAELTTSGAIKIHYHIPYDQLLKKSRQNNEGCGATTALSITNQYLAKAIRGELNYPKNFNVEKLKSDWTSRLNLALFYQKKTIIESQLEVSKTKFSDIDDKRQRTIAGIEAIKTVADIAIISKTDPVDISNPGASAVLIVGHLGGLVPSLSKVFGVKETLKTPAADLMKASTDFMYYSTDMSKYKASLVSAAANSVKAYLGFTDQSETWTRTVETFSAGISCVIEKSRTATIDSSCIAAQVELLAKASVDWGSSFLLVRNRYNYEALASALDYLEAYYISAGDLTLINRRTGGLNTKVLPSVAEFYDKKRGGINKDLFIATVNEFISLINASTRYYQGKIARG